MFLLISPEGNIEYYLTTDENGFIDAIHTSTSFDRSEEHIKMFIKIMPDIEGFKLIDITTQSITIQDNILEDLKTKGTINIRDYKLKDEVAL